MNMSLFSRVQAVLERLRPALKADGQEFELLDIAGHTARIRLRGAGTGQAGSTMPVTAGLERAIQLEVPEIERVEVTT